MTILQEILICLLGEGKERAKLILFFIGMMILMLGLTAMCSFINFKPSTECTRYETRVIMMGKSLVARQICAESRNLYP